MKHIFRLSLLLLLSNIILNSVNAQIFDPVKWDFSSKKIGDCEYELIFKAKIDGKWHMYGQKSYGDDGPIPTSFHFTKSSNYELIGKTSESKLIKKFEPVWNVELNFFEHEAVFKQKIKIKSDKSFEIKDTLEFMVCNESQCLPPTAINFNFKIQGSAACIVKNTSTKIQLGECDSNAIYQVLNLRNNKFNTKSTKADTSAATTVFAQNISVQKNEQSETSKR